MDILFDMLKILGRIITILPLLLIVTLFMGKRSIGELPVFDFLIILTLGAVVGADIADPDINHLFTFLSVIAIGMFQYIVSKWKMNNRRFGRLITFEPTIVIRHGTFLIDNMRKIRYSVDNVLQMLREKDVFDVSEVELALIEANGSLSVFKKPSKSVPEAEDFGMEKTASHIAYPVIVEGKVYSSVLTDLHLDKSWLEQQIERKGLKVKDVFFASVNEKGELHLSLYKEGNLSGPKIRH